MRRGRRLFIARSVVGNADVSWPGKHFGGERVVVVSNTGMDRAGDVLSVLTSPGLWLLAHAGGLATR
ncbi:MAG: hypothetical protein FWD57_12245 [Polyangiaceae bacterium]|nr:hypothetical protein [Polyangiaceae bacterium]